MNKVFLIGNLTRDAELSETSSGTAVCRFSIAVSRNYTSADGEKKSDFFNCIAWRGLGEAVGRYAHKGDKIAVTGSIEMRNYEDREGNKRTAVDIVAQEVEFLTYKPREDSGTDKQPTAPANAPQSPKSKPKLMDFDDDSDIPF